MKRFYRGSDNAMRHELVDTKLLPTQPLWQRAPSRDRNGRPLSDFMVRIPKLGSAPAFRRERIGVELRAVFQTFSQQVHFADLNLDLNLVWISVDARPGLIPELAGEIRRRIPEAVLIGHDWGEPPRRESRPQRLIRGFSRRIRRLAGRRRALAPPDSGTD